MKFEEESCNEQRSMIKIKDINGEERKQFTGVTKEISEKRIMKFE